jgi:hypothetical protein
MKISSTAVSVLAFLALALSSPVSAQQGKLRLYINGTGNTDIRTEGSVVGGYGWGVGSAHSTVGAHNQTMELAKDFTKECPDVTVTLSSADADYTVDMNHEAFHGLIHKNNQIMVTNRRGDLVFSNATRAVSHSVNDACAALHADWNKNGRIEAPIAPAPVNAIQSPSIPVAAPVVPVYATAVAQPQPTTLVTLDYQPESVGEAARRNKANKIAAAVAQKRQQPQPAPPQPNQ